MPRKKKNALPSGNVRVQVFVGYRADGSRRYESFTDPDPHVANADASAFRLKVKRLRAQGVPVDDIPREGEGIRRSDTVEYCLEQYLDTCRSCGLSPSTLMEYKNTIRRAYAQIKSIPAQMLTASQVQAYVNERAKTVSAKTIRNELGILTAALVNVRPDFTTRTIKLPKTSKTEMRIPSDGELQKILDACKGTPLYLPVVLASMMGLRRSEIAALRWQDIDMKNRTMSIRAAAVTGEDGLAYKPPKTEAGYRTLPIPSTVLPVLVGSRTLSPKVSDLTPNAITRRYERLMDSLGFPYRFHDLRHYHASAMIAVGAPDKYICADMGHASMDMVRRVYGHVMEDREREINKKMEKRAKAFSL